MLRVLRKESSVNIRELSDLRESLPRLDLRAGSSKSPSAFSCTLQARFRGSHKSMKLCETELPIGLGSWRPLAHRYVHLIDRAQFEVLFLTVSHFCVFFSAEGDKPIHTFSWKFEFCEGAESHRFSRKTGDSRRKLQEAADWGPLPLVRPLKGGHSFCFCSFVWPGA